MSEKAIVAVDLGAQSCRVSLLRWKHEVAEVCVTHRFPNAPVSSARGLTWDIERIFAGILNGLRKCAESAPEGIASIGIDGWAVDYVRIGRDGKALGDPFCYRDERTTQAMQEVLRLISPERLYALTGIQLLSLNSIFQLYADKIAGVEAESGWLNLPEYVTHLLGGRPVAEYTNATHTQLVSIGEQEWCREIFRATDLELSAAPELVDTGTFVGPLAGEVRHLPAFRDTQLIVPACHDTASAIAAIPAVGDDWAFISSGTWSLVGTVLRRPCATDEARKLNFTNLGGVGGTFCFLKNVNGTWLLRQCMDEWAKNGQTWSVGELLRECEKLPPPAFLIDVDDPQLMVPGDLPDRINFQLNEAEHAPLPFNRRGVVQMANLIFHSLAQRYAEVLSAAARVTGRKLRRLFIVGGGGRNRYLNRLTAERTGLEVHCGSSEASTIGNFAVQMAAFRGNHGSRSGAGTADLAKWTSTLSAVTFTDFME